MRAEREAREYFGLVRHRPAEHVRQHGRLHAHCLGCASAPRASVRQRTDTSHGPMGQREWQWDGNGIRDGRRLTWTAKHRSIFISSSTDCTCNFGSCQRQALRSTEGRRCSRTCGWRLSSSSGTVCAGSNVTARLIQAGANLDLPSLGAFFSCDVVLPAVCTRCGRHYRARECRRPKPTGTMQCEPPRPQSPPCPFAGASVFAAGLQSVAADAAGLAREHKGRACLRHQLTARCPAYHPGRVMCERAWGVRPGRASLRSVVSCQTARADCCFRSRPCPASCPSSSPRPSPSLDNGTRVRHTHSTVKAHEARLPHSSTLQIGGKRPLALC